MPSSGSRLVVMAGLGLSAAMAAAKLGAASHSSSSALLASTVHTLIDMSCLSLLLYGLRRADAAVAAGGPAAAAAREVPFWGNVVALALYAMGAGVALHGGAERLARPHDVMASLSEVGVLGLGALLAAGLCWFAFVRLRGTRAAGLPLIALMRRPGNAALFTTLLVAAAAVLGQLIALAGMATASSRGDRMADAGAAMAVGLVMAAVAAVMANEIRRLLTDAHVQSADRPSSAAVEQPVAEAPAPALDLPALEVKSMPSPPAAAGAPAQLSGDGGKPQVVARGQGRKGRGKRRR